MTNKSETYVLGDTTLPPGYAPPSALMNPNATVAPVPDAKPDGETPLEEGVLAEIEARAALATGGPWWADHERLAVCTDDLRTLIYVLLDGSDSRTHHPRASADAEFIAAARTDVPRLVAALRAAWAELRTARGQHHQDGAK